MLGELRTGNPLSQILHQNAHFIEQLALGDLDGVVTTIVPFPLEHSVLHDDDQSQDAQLDTLDTVVATVDNDRKCGGQCQGGIRMMNIALSVIITDILWVMVIAGWILLIVTGLEADKPLSGGIPGHVDLHDLHSKFAWARGDKIGEIGGWVIFAAVSALLPLILYWIFNVHGR
ncbi:MAG: hypothetical protein IPK16_29810 [Anaerolineales bacterium]|nr:hypothetical protein [Anaerolineales bacterium]